MILLIFDVDGTLTDTSLVDKLCYHNTFKRFFDLDISDLEFMDYDNVTDNGLVFQVMKQYYNISEPDWTDFYRAKSGFMIELFDAYKGEPSHCKAVEGGVNMWNKMVESSKIHLALATGCWEDSAYFKLEKAGYDIANIPFSHNDVALTRTQILQNAVAQSKLFYQHNRYDKVIYVGDGVWDYHVTQQLEMPLIGIDIKQNNKLKDLGCQHVLPNYNNIDLLEEYLLDI